MPRGLMADQRWAEYNRFMRKAASAKSPVLADCYRRLASVALDLHFEEVEQLVRCRVR
jgi:hypothetical protein